MQLCVIVFRRVCCAQCHPVDRNDVEDVRRGEKSAIQFGVRVCVHLRRVYYRIDLDLFLVSREPRKQRSLRGGK